MFARLLLLALLASLPDAAIGQCVPKPYSAKHEVFSSVVQNLKGPAARVGPAGIELSIEKRAEGVLATLRDYDGSPFPSETKLEGTLHESRAGCDLSLSGQGRRGKVEIHGNIFVAIFRGTIRRQIGKEMLSEKVLLRRKRAEPNERIEVGMGGAANALPPTGRAATPGPLSSSSISFLRAIRVRAE
jgi:hypothetical protein